MLNGKSSEVDDSVPRGRRDVGKKGRCRVDEPEKAAARQAGGCSHLRPGISVSV